MQKESLKSYNLLTQTDFLYIHTLLACYGSDCVSISIYHKSAHLPFIPYIFSWLPVIDRNGIFSLIPSRQKFVIIH